MESAVCKKLGPNPTKAEEEEGHYEVESSRWAFINMQGIVNKVEEVKELMDREKNWPIGDSRNLACTRTNCSGGRV